MEEKSGGGGGRAGRLVGGEDERGRPTDSSLLGSPLYYAHERSPAGVPSKEKWCYGKIRRDRHRGGQSSHGGGRLGIIVSILTKKVNY